MDFVLGLIDKGPELLTSFLVVIGAFTGFLTALIGFFMLIPGPQPEKALQAVVNFLKFFSKK